jgi:hypothetical protein
MPYICQYLCIYEIFGAVKDVSYNDTQPVEQLILVKATRMYPLTQVKKYRAETRYFCDKKGFRTGRNNSVQLTQLTYARCRTKLKILSGSFLNGTRNYNHIVVLGVKKLIGRCSHLKDKHIVYLKTFKCFGICKI